MMSLSGHHLQEGRGGVSNFLSVKNMNTLLRLMRLLWQTRIQVLSMKLMPVHSPKQNSSRNMAIWTATRDSSSTKRLYDTFYC